MDPSMSAENVDAVIERCLHDTMFCSGVDCMREQQGYVDLVAFSNAAVTPIMRHLENDPSMALQHALSDILGYWPEGNHVVYDGVVVKITVDASAAAWREWGREHGYLGVEE